MDSGGFGRLSILFRGVGEADCLGEIERDGFGELSTLLRVVGAGFEHCG